jgi:hypothetical protein
MHTEAEARELWCPMHRDLFIVDEGAAAVNDNTKCIASRCAMWRWEYPTERASESKGYCGLAGRPM